MSETVNTSGAYIIVTGNEKGGCGKTTVTMHLAVSLLYDGMKVATIDLDARQRSLSRYIENRIAHAETLEKDLPQLTHYIVNKSDLPNKAEAEADERGRFEACLAKAVAEHDVVIVDAPGNDTYLSRLAHSYADTIVTPINDSFIDLDVIAHVKEETLDMSRPGVYSEVVWQAKMQRAKRDRGEIDWVVLRNRLSNLDAHNKRQMADALDKLSKKTGCRIAQGFSERVIYRELFLKGLTLLDIMDEKSSVKVRMTHIAARQELRELVHFLDLAHRVQQKVGGEASTSGGGGFQYSEALSNVNEAATDEKTQEQEEVADAPKPLPKNRAEDAEILEEAPAAPATVSANTSMAAENAQASTQSELQSHHYTLDELSKIEEEIETREGVVDRLEDLQDDANTPETSIQTAADDVAHALEAEGEIYGAEQPSASQPQPSESAPAEEGAGLSDETKSRLNEMLAKSKQYVDASDEHSVEDVSEGEHVTPDNAPSEESAEAETERQN